MAILFYFRHIELGVHPFKSTSKKVRNTKKFLQIFGEVLEFAVRATSRGRRGKCGGVLEAGVYAYSHARRPGQQWSRSRGRSAHARSRTAVEEKQLVLLS